MAMDLGNDFGGISYSPPKKKDEEENKNQGAAVVKAGVSAAPVSVERGQSGSGSTGPLKVDFGFDFNNGVQWNGPSDSGGSWQPPTEPEPQPTYEPESEPEPEPQPEPEPAKSPVVPETISEATEESSENGNVGNRAQESKPVVYEGGGLRTSRDRMANVNLKQELEEETSTGGLPADFWNWSAERQQAYLSNPDNMAAAIGQANRQAEQARRDAAVERANRATRENAINRAGMAAAAQAAGGGPARNLGDQDSGVRGQGSGGHYLGAGPAEPGTWNYTTATGPQLEREVPAHDYRSTYQYDPNLTVENLTVNNPQWLAENGLSWAGAGAGQAAGGQEGTQLGGQSPVPASRQQETGPVRPGALTRVSDDYPGGYQAMFEDGVRIRMDRGESREEAEANTRADILRQNLLAAGGTSNPNVIRFEPGAGASEQVPSTRDDGQEETQHGGQSPVPASRQQETGPVRPGVDAVVNSWDEENGLHYMGAGPAEPGTENYTTATGPKSGGTGNGSGKAVVNTGGSGSGGTSTGKEYGPGTNNGGKSGNAPKGSLYLNPTYDQGGTVVKAPYKAGGYSEDELITLGNRSAYKDSYGHPFYEGYYYWNGKYYPVDQEKANYYRQNGNSYKGWDEGMRDYYKTFGTFYGYRPDWKSAGRNVSNRSYSRSYSYGGGGGSYGSGGRSYGSGSTANNGLYWNPNSSWSI